jgi:hypothetical protein
VRCVRSRFTAGQFVPEERSFARVRLALGLDPIQESLFEEKVEAATASN